MAPYSSFGGFPEEGGTEAFLRRALKGCDLPVFLYNSYGEGRKETRFSVGGGGGGGGDDGLVQVFVLMVGGGVAFVAAGVAGVEGDGVGFIGYGGGGVLCWFWWWWFGGGGSCVVWWCWGWWLWW